MCWDRLLIVRYHARTSSWVRGQFDVFITLGTSFSHLWRARTLVTHTSWVMTTTLRKFLPLYWYRCDRVNKRYILQDKWCKWIKNKTKVKLTNSIAYETCRCNAAIHKGSPITPIFSPINPIPRIDTCCTTVLYCIVLCCVVGVLIAAQALGPFKIYCAPPNLSITRTWICRLNFAQRPIFSGLRFFYEPEISDSGPPA